MKSIYAIVNAATGKTQGDAFTMKSEALANASKLNQLCRHEAKTGSPIRKFAVASINPEMAGNLNVNPYATR